MIYYCNQTNNKKNEFEELAQIFVSAGQKLDDTLKLTICHLNCLFFSYTYMRIKLLLL